MVCLCCQRWAVISKTQMKNTKKLFNRDQMKSDNKDKKEVPGTFCDYRPVIPVVCIMLLFFLPLPVWCHDWQTEDAERREKNLEEAKKIIIENDPSLPEPKTVSEFCILTECNIDYMIALSYSLWWF